MAGTMTRQSARPTVGRRARTKPGAGDDFSPKPTLLVGLAVAAWIAALGLAVLICLALTAWVTAAHHDDAIQPAIGMAIQAWLLAQHAVVDIGSGSVSVVPLGLTIALGALLVRGGRQAAHLSGATDLFGAATSAIAIALPYSVIAALLTKPAQVGAAHPSVLQALAGAFTLSLACASVGALRETGRLTPLLARIPSEARAAIRAALAASAVVVGAAAAVFAVSLVVHAGRAADLAGSMHGGLSGVALLAVICLAYTPNAIIWTAAYLLGPGFAVGTHTSVSVTGAHLGAVPSLPLLAPLPGAASPPLFGWLLIAAPIAAGVAAGWMLARGCAMAAPAGDAPWWQRYRLLDAARGVAAGAVSGLLLGVLASLSGGSLGGGHLRTLGPSAWWTATAATIEIGAVAAATIWLLGWRRTQAA